MWCIGVLAFAVTFTCIVMWMCESRRVTRKQLKHHVSLNMEVRLARTIVYFPIHICGMALLTLFYPATAYSLEMVMAIAASVVMGCLVQYYLNALGGGKGGPSSERLLERTPEKKWWMHSCCGGVNDMLPLMGYIYSREPHRLTLPDIHRAVHLVELFMILYISTSIIKVGLSVVPTTVHMTEEGWCVDDNVVSDGFLNVIMILQILSTFIGSSGFAIISTAAHEVYESLDPENDYNFKRKGSAGSAYLTLPLLNVFLAFIPLSGKNTKIPLPVPISTQALADGHYTTTYKTLECPIFDKTVCTAVLFCTLVACFMAWIAYVQTRIYRPDETFEDLYATTKHLQEPDFSSESSEEEACM